MFTGLLREELLTPNWEHVDREARAFRVRHARGTLSSELPVRRDEFVRIRLREEVDKLV